MIKQKLKIAFATVFSLVTLSLVGGILYLQSGRFADSVKHLISERSPQKLGIIGDFSNLKLYFFPPAIGIANPTIHIERENISKLPMEGDIEAKEVRVSFAPIQMLSGTLQVDEFAVMGGSVQGKIGADAFKSQKKQKTSQGKLQWQDLFQLQINGVRFVDTFLKVEIELPQSDHPKLGAELVVKDLNIKKANSNGKGTVISHALVNAVKFDIPKKFIDLPLKEATQLQWDFELTDEGLNLSPFIMELPGMNLTLNGKLTGNILEDKKDLNLSANVSMTTGLETFFASNFNDDAWRGDAIVTAKIQAKLNDLVHTLKGSFQVNGTDIVWKDVHANKLEGNGVLDLAAQKIDLKTLNLYDHSNPGQVGELKIENLAMPFKFNEAFHAKLAFKDADMHWLGGVVLSAVYPMEGKFTGTVDAQFVPNDLQGGKRNQWKLKADTDLSVAHFALTNQSLKKEKPKHYVLRPPLPILLKGGLEISPAGLEFKKFNVKVVKSAFDITGGVYSGTGFGFVAKGFADLSEVNEIAESKILGSGDLIASIHGPSSGVLLDFDVQAKEVEYLNLKLGEVKGRVTYDDGTEELKFTNIKAHQKNTFYSLDQGYIDLSGSDAIRMPFAVHSGRVEDLSYILNFLTKKISWYPQTLRGEIHGNVDLSGKIDMPHLIISSELEGSDWIWMGERARKVKMDFGYDEGTYYSHDVDITKTNGDIKGDIDFNSKTDDLSWDFLTEGLSLSDVDFVDRLELPTKSKIELQSKGAGKLDHIKSKSEGRIFNTEIKGESYEPTTFSLELGESTIRGNLNVFGKQVQAQMKYALTPKQPSSFKIDFNQFDFSPVLLILNPKLLDDSEFHAGMEGKFQLDFLSTQAELARGQIQVKNYFLKKTGFAVNLIDPINVPVQLGYFNLPPSRFRFKDTDLVLSGEGKKGNLDLRLLGGIDLAAAEVFSSVVQKVKGKADADIQLKGPLKNIKVNGDFNFSDANVLLRFMQTPFEGVDGTIRIRQDQILVEGVEASLGDEVFTLAGKIETFADRFPSLDLRAQFEDNKIKMSPLDLAQVRGVATIKGDQAPYIIGGNLDLVQGLWTKSFSQGSGLTVRGERFAPVDSERQATSNLFNLDLNVNANQGFFIRNEIIDGEFKGKVKLVGPVDNPKLLGEGQLVQGKILFRDRPFILESVKVTFDDPFQMDPKFNAAAVAEVPPYKIRILAYGRASQYKAEFSSTPFLPVNDIYMLLASGTTIAESNRFRANRDKSFVNQGEAASLILHSLDFSKDVQNKTGLQFDVEEAIDTQSASSIFSPQALGENVAAPKLVIKRSLGRNLGLSFGSTVGVGNQAQKELKAEYKITNGFSLLGVWNNIEEQSTVNTPESRTSYGLDVKLNKKFK